MSFERVKAPQKFPLPIPAFVRKNYKTVTGLPLYVNFWLHKDKNLESALEAGKRTVELMPNNWLTWYWISQIYIKQKNYREALIAAEKALSNAPQEAKTAFHFQEHVNWIKTQIGAEKK